MYMYMKETYALHMYMYCTRMYMYNYVRIFAAVRVVCLRRARESAVLK